MQNDFDLMKFINETSREVEEQLTATEPDFLYIHIRPSNSLYRQTDDTSLRGAGGGLGGAEEGGRRDREKGPINRERLCKKIGE